MSRSIGFMAAVIAAVLLVRSAHAKPPILHRYPGTTVAVYDCGNSPTVAAGSSPYAGQVIPDPAATQCSIYFNPPGTLDPLDVIVDGTSPSSPGGGDFVAPKCAMMIAGPHTKEWVATTAAGFRVDWDIRINAAPQPVPFVSWTCSYPWAPAGGVAYP